MKSMAAEPVPGEVDQALWCQVHVVNVKIVRFLPAVLPPESKISNDRPSGSSPVQLVGSMQTLSASWRARI